MGVGLRAFWVKTKGRHHSAVGLTFPALLFNATLNGLPTRRRLRAPATPPVPKTDLLLGLLDHIADLRRPGLAAPKVLGVRQPTPKSSTLGLILTPALTLTLPYAVLASSEDF